MTFSVIDSAAAMSEVLKAASDARTDLVREMWSPLAGMYHFVPGGVDMAAVHRQNFGFDWENPTPLVEQGVESSSKRMLGVASPWHSSAALRR